MICLYNKINKEGFHLPCLTQCPGNIRKTYLMQKNTALQFFSVGQFVSCHAVNMAHIWHTITYFIMHGKTVGLLFGLSGMPCSDALSRQLDSWNCTASKVLMRHPLVFDVMAR